MYCRNCGSQLPDTARFCMHCGMAQPVNENLYQQQQPVQSQFYIQPYQDTPPMYTQQQPAGEDIQAVQLLGWILWIVAFVLPGIVAIVVNIITIIIGFYCKDRKRNAGVALITVSIIMLCLLLLGYLILAVR